MKYIFLNELNCLKSKKKTIIIYIICLLTYCLLNIQLKKLISIDNIQYKALGIVLNYDFLDILMYILNKVFYIFIILSIFMNDFKQGGQFLFSRIKKNNYMLYKIILMFIIVLTLKAIFFIFVNIICNTNIDILVYLLDINITVFLNIVIISAIIINKQVFYIIALLIILLMVFGNNYLIYNNLALIILMCLNLFLTLFSEKYTSKYLFYTYERSLFNGN